MSELIARRTWSAVALAAALALVVTPGCATRNERYSIVRVPADDPHMNAAIHLARASVGRFETALRSPKPSQWGFSVKVRIADGDEAEHFWLSDVSFDGRSFHGLIANDPAVVKTVTFGQAMAESPRKISDWMYIDHGILVGGYTVRVLRDTLSPSDRADFDKSAPFAVR